MTPGAATLAHPPAPAGSEPTVPRPVTVLLGVAAALVVLSLTPAGRGVAAPLWAAALAVLLLALVLEVRAWRAARVRRRRAGRARP